MLLGLRLSLECEREAPVTSGHALLVSCCASTTLRPHAVTALFAKWTVMGLTAGLHMEYGANTHNKSNICSAS